MGERSIKESFPGSGVTKSGARINPNMKDYSNSPYIIRSIERAKAAWEDPGLQRLFALCIKKRTARRNRFQRNSSRFRKICVAIKLKFNRPKFVIKNPFLAQV